jgi:hypothetical protein
MLALVDWPKEAAKAQDLIAKAAAEMAAAAADAAVAEHDEEEEGTPGDAETGDAVPALEAAPRVASAFAAGAHACAHARLHLHDSLLSATCP